MTPSTSGGYIPVSSLSLLVQENTHKDGEQQLFLSQKKHLITLNWIKLKISSKAILSSSTFPCTWWNSKTETINKPEAEVWGSKRREQRIGCGSCSRGRGRKESKNVQKAENPIFGWDWEIINNTKPTWQRPFKSTNCFQRKLMTWVISTLPRKVKLPSNQFYLCPCLILILCLMNMDPGRAVTSSCALLNIHHRWLLWCDAQVP